MNKARSIKQNARPDGLPNFRNVGTLLRILLISNGLALLQAILLASAWTDVAQRMMQIATLLTPVLLTSLLLLWVAQPWLNRLSYRRGVLAAVSYTHLVGNSAGSALPRVNNVRWLTSRISKLTTPGKAMVAFAASAALSAEA